MKKILLLLKKNILILALVAVVAVVAGGIFKIKKMKQEIKELEEEINTTYGQLKSYHKDTENAPSPQLTKRLEKEKVYNEKLFEIILIAGIKNGDFREELDSFVVSQDIVVVGHIWPLRQWALSKDIDFENYLEAQVDFIMNGCLKPQV